MTQILFLCFNQTPYDPILEYTDCNNMKTTSSRWGLSTREINQGLQNVLLFILLLFELELSWSAILSGFHCTFLRAIIFFISFNINYLVVFLTGMMDSLQNW